MKLWQKIFLCVLLLITVAIDLTAIVLVRGSYTLLLSQERERCAAEQRALEDRVTSQVVYRRLAQNRLMLDEEAVTAVWQNSLEESAAGGAENWGAAVYTADGETPVVGVANAGVIVGTTGSADRAALAQEGVYSLRECAFEGRQYLLTASTLTLEGQDYALFTAADITAVYTAKTQQLRFVRWMSLACAAVSALVLLLLVRRLLRPLGRLEAVTRTIAGGDYAVRAPESGGVELRQLAADMNVMAAAVEENVAQLTAVAEERRLFIANLSHEMKTPLTSILGFADILRLSDDLPPGQRREYAGIIVEEAGRLKALSGKLMELLTAGSVALSHEEISLPALCGEAAAALSGVLAGREITLSVSAQEAVFWGDAALLKSLLYNLLDNAAKASARGGRILLRGETAGGTVRLQVADSGIGMSPETVARATQPFYMGDKSRSRRAGGAGLGLALCDEIARAHGGALQIDSVLGRGTTVTVTLPRGMERGESR